MAINHKFNYSGSLLLVCLVFASQSWLTRDAAAQRASSTPVSDLVVHGRVEKVYQSGDEALVQILVQRSEAPQLVSDGSIRYPAPGEFVYVHSEDSGRFRQQVATPRPGTELRAFLSAGKSGQWEAAGSQWYRESPSGAEGGSARGSTSDAEGNLGVTTERVPLGRTTALKVINVRPNSAAANAGVEPGDIVVEANRKPVGSQRELDDAFRNSRDQFSLTVRDVRSSRDVLVKVEPYSGQPGPAINTGPQSLGIMGKLAFYQGEPALEVTEVAPRSPADRAGMNVGDLILEANGNPVKSAENLEAAARETRGVLGLKVADPKTRRERTLRVSM